VRGDLTIHAVDTIDEVLKFALENVRIADVLETPQIWTTDGNSDGVSATIE